MQQEFSGTRLEPVWGRTEGAIRGAKTLKASKAGEDNI